MCSSDLYEPPEDPDSGKSFLSHWIKKLIILLEGLSLEELGMRALNRLPRERAIDGIMAFNAMR